MLTCVNLWEAHVAYIGNSAIYISVAVARLSRRQCDIYIGGSATLISAAVWHLPRRQCHTCIGGGATYYIGSSVMYMYVLAAALRLSGWWCNVFLSGSATLISAAVPRLSRRQCDTYLGGSVTFISTAVWRIYRRQCHSYICVRDWYLYVQSF